MTPGEHRAAFVAGLRELADFYEQHPDMPVPAYPDLGSDIQHTTANPGGDEQDRRAAVIRVAAVLGVQPKPRMDGGVVAGREFGPIRVAVHHIPDEAMRRHRADMSYSGSVEPEPEQPVGGAS